MIRRSSINPLVLVTLLLGCAAVAAASSSISGTVSAREGQKVTTLARAFVSVRATSGNLLGTTRTDRNGSYQLSGLPLQRFILTASKPGYVTQLAAGRAGSRIVVDCSAGCDERAADFELIPAAVITGTVRDTLGEPIQRARVSVKRADSSSSRDGGAIDQSDDRGRFRLAGLRAGPHTLTVEGRPPGKKAEVLTRSLEVHDGEQLDGLDLILGIQGTFKVAGRLSGVPLGEDYRTWISLGRIGGGRWRNSSNVGRDGSFRFEGVAAGRYWATGFASKRGSGARTDYMLGPLDVDADIEGLSLRPLEPASITGVVEIDAGTPPARAAIQLTSNEGFGRQWFRFGQPNREFELSGVIPGSYRIHTRSGQFYVKGIKSGERVEPADQVRLSPGQNRLTILIAADHGEVSGTVRDPATGNPLPHARVALEGKRGKHLVQADQAGRFLFGKVIPGEYRICAWADIAAEEVAADGVWERAGCEFKIIPIDAESEIEIDLRAAP